MAKPMQQKASTGEFSQGNCSEETSTGDGELGLWVAKVKRGRQDLFTASNQPGETMPDSCPRVIGVESQSKGYLMDKEAEELVKA